MKKFLLIPIVFLFLCSCESKLTKLKNERDQLQIELNELQKKQQESGIRSNADLQRYLKQQEPILKRAREINQQIKEIENK